MAATSYAMKQSLSSGVTAVPGLKSTLNQRAALVSAYNELGKELASTKLKSVGNYTLGRTIGEGTFGKVRIGTHRLLGTRVAIKQVPKAHSASLTREIHHHRRLHHTHVMKLYEVLATEANIWMISELCLGGELYNYLVERGTLPEGEAKRIFGQLCLAVAYVHGQGIVHRDLKLENVLLDERCNVKLGDFGFTREFEGKRLMETFCGTTGYAAPEMLAGKKYTGEEVDIWSLGIILYALLYGSLPFDDDDEGVMKTKILSGDFELPDIVSEEARALVSDILRLDPTQRPTIKTILSHPWFTKVVLVSPMSTVDEHADVDYFGNAASTSPSLQNTEHLAGGTAAEESDAVAVAAPAREGLGVDLGASSASQDGSSQLSNTSHKNSDDEAGFSDRMSRESISTNATSADELSLSSHGAVTTAVAASDPSDSGEPSLTRTSMGMQHRNESQSTIRRGYQSECYRASMPVATSSALTLATHHERDTESSKNRSQLAAASSSSLARNKGRPGNDSVALAKKDSQNSSKSHHRTPSRTKRRSLSSNGLSDHHPPHLTTKPVDFCAMLEQQQPALFSTDLEQNLLYQLGNLGMDVGQMVHSILTDACDASAAMWWILKQKAQAKHENAGTSSSSKAAPVLTSGANLVSTLGLAAPPLPPKDPLHMISGVQTSSSTPSPSNKTDGLPLTAQDSFLQRMQISGTNQKAQDRCSRNKVESKPQGLTEVTPPVTESISLPSEGRRVLTPPPMELCSPPSLTDGVMSEVAGKVTRPRPSRDRTNSLSLKLASVLGGKKEGPVSELHKNGAEEETEKSFASSKGMVGIFSRKPTGGHIAQRGTVQGERAVSQPLSTKASNSNVEILKAALSPISDGDRSSTKAKDRFGSPSKCGIKDNMMQSAAPVAPNSNNSCDRLSGSRSMDTFSTISSYKSDDHGAVDSDGAQGYAGKSRNKSSSFMTTVRTWLGTEDKQARKRGKKGLAGSSQALAGTAHAGDPVASNLQRRKSRAGQRTVSNHGAGSIASRRHPRTGSGQSPSTHRQSNAEIPASMSLTDTHRSSFSLYSPLRHPSAGSITPTALYGTTPSRAPSVSSLYRNTITSPSALLARAPSVSSNHSGRRSNYQSQNGAGHRDGAGRSSGLTSSSGSFRGLSGRRMSSDGGTVVIRHRVHHRPRSESSRPNSLIDPSDSASGIVGDPDDSLGALLTAGPSEPTSGVGTPRRASVDSRRDLDSLYSRPSPSGVHSVFMAHRSRHSYKPPSANPALFLRRPVGTHVSSDSKGDPLLPPNRAGVWRKSWGQPPPVWLGPVDPSSPMSEGPGSSTVRTVSKVGSNSTGLSEQPPLRDVFSSRRFGSSDDEWEDEDDGPVFSGGLGQLDSNGLGTSSMQALDLPSTPNSLPAFTGQSSPVLGGSGRFDRNRAGDSWGRASIKGGSAGSAFSSRYAGVRSAFQTPVLGRDVAPRMISVSESTDATPDASNGALESYQKTAMDPLSVAPEAANVTKDDAKMSAPVSGTSCPASRLRSSAVASFFTAVEEEDEEGEDG